MISTDHGYRTSHVVSTKFLIIINLLLLYCVNSKNLVLGSIIVTEFNIKVSILFLHILYRPMRYSHSLFHSFSSARLVGSLPYFAVDRFVHCHVSQPVTSFWTVSLMPGYYTYWWIVASVLSSPGWGRYKQYHFTKYFWSICEMTILFLYFTSSILFWTLQK